MCHTQNSMLLCALLDKAMDEVLNRNLCQTCKSSNYVDDFCSGNVSILVASSNEIILEGCIKSRRLA